MDEYIKNPKNKKHVLAIQQDIIQDTEKKESAIYATVWIYLENIMLRQRSQTQRAT